MRLDKIVTGTYNVPGNYKVVYKTNLNPNYCTMYDNLSTQQNYVLDASKAALGLASNEYVTEFMVSFGVVPANFRQVEAPQVYATVYAWLTGGSQFVNQADVGGVYNGQWIMATSRWVTKVYKPTDPCPAPAIDSGKPSSGGPPNPGGPFQFYGGVMNEYQKKGRPDPAPGPGGGRPVRGPGLRILLRRQRGGRRGADLDRRRRPDQDRGGHRSVPRSEPGACHRLFVKLAMAYFDYRKHGQFEWTGPAILFVCLIFVLLAPNYIWNIVGI